MEKVNLDNVPKKPGVYIWKDSYDNILYIGKAIDLKKRMSQYFKPNLHSYRIPKMVSEINSFEYIITSSEKDALILERNLIEKHKPTYNSRLKDDKIYPYIKVKMGNPLLIQLSYRVRQDRDDAFFFGPFPNGYGAKKIANLLNRISVYKNGLPYKTSNLSYWQEKFNETKKLLQGGVVSLSKKLEEQMLNAAKNQQFEIAADIKLTLQSLNHYSESQLNQLSENKNIDVIAFFKKDDFLSITIFFYKSGSMLSKRDHVIRINASEEDSIRQFVSQFYLYNSKPDYIISNKHIENEVEVLVPQKGNKKKILESALENAKDNVDLKLKEFKGHENRTFGAINKLKEILKIKSASLIQMVDTSSTNNTHPVVAVISYRNGLPSFHEYRKYSVDINQRKADVDYMEQGLIKHFNKKDAPKPDVFIVDGGIAQINAVKHLIPPDTKILGLVKDDNHKTSKLINEHNTEIKIDDQDLFRLLTKMQIEVDSYAKRSHNKKRLTTLEGKLLSIKGIGVSTESKLLNHFKTYSAIYNASIDELKEVVPENLAIEIKRGLNNERNN